MSEIDKDGHSGHRERLKNRFRSNPGNLSEIEKIELLLTYLIPRKDVSDLAVILDTKFGDFENLISAPESELQEIPGIGESTITFFMLIKSLQKPCEDNEVEMRKKKSPQPTLFETDSPGEVKILKTNLPKKKTMSVFVNDEISNSLNLLPKASSYASIDAYKKFLVENLPYNAAETRNRRADYILERFFSEGDVHNSLSYFLDHCSSQKDIKPVIFYHMLQAEPIAVKIAEDLIWPALPLGRVEREQIREFFLRYFPNASKSSQNYSIRSILNTYNLLDIGTENGSTLHFKLHNGTLESFLYTLTTEFSEPGIYSFDAIYKGPLHHWLLWDREWIRQQLYNLQDFGILTKVSEIDTLHQFSLPVDQRQALRIFFENPDHHQKAIREQENDQ